MARKKKSDTSSTTDESTEKSSNQTSTIDTNTSDEHVPSSGSQWELGPFLEESSTNKLKSSYNVNMKISDEYTHHSWQEVSHVKSIRNIGEAIDYLSNDPGLSDTKNAKVWSELGLLDVIKNIETTYSSDESIRKEYDLNENGVFNKPISTFSLLKKLAQHTEDEMNAKNKAAADAASEDEAYKQYIPQFSRDGSNYRQGDYRIGFYSENDVADLANQYKGWGGQQNTDFVINPPSGSNKKYEMVVKTTDFMATIYNNTTAVKLAKEKAKYDKAKTKSEAKSAKASLARQKNAKIQNYYEVASGNDKVRKAKARIEELRLADEEDLAELKKKNDEKLNAEKAANEEEARSWADKYAEMNGLDRNSPEVQEAEQKHLDEANRKSEYKYELENYAASKKVASKTNNMNSKIKDAPAVSGTTDLYNEQQQENAEAGQKKKKFGLSDLKALASKAMDLFNAAKSGNLAGALGITGGKGLSINNPKLMKAMSKFGFKSGLLDNVLGDLVNVAGAYAANMVESLVKLGLSKLYSSGGNDTADEMMKKLVQGLAYAGGDPNYKNTFLKVIIEADYPKCLAYLDEYNNVESYTLDSPEYKRGKAAAANGCHKVAKYVADNLYKTYLTYKADGAVTANEDKALAIANEIRDIFKTVVVYSYSNFDVSDLKDWLKDDINGGFASIITPSILSTDDAVCNGKYGINDSDLGKIAPIVVLKELNTEGLENTVSLSSSSGVTFNDANGNSGAFSEDNVASKDKYIDPRNTNIKKIYAHLVSSQYIELDRMTNQPFHDRLKIQVVTILKSAENAAMNTLLRSDTFKDVSHIINNMVRATIHNTITLMDKYHLIMRASDNKVTAWSDDSIPEFVDYTKNTVTLIGCGGMTDSGEEKVKIEFSNTKEVQVPKNPFTKKGFVLTGWASEEGGEVTYGENDKFIKRTDFTLYAVWAVDESSGGEEQPGEEINAGNPPSASATIKNNKTKEELEKEAEKFIRENVKLSSTFTKLGMSLDNFEVIDTYGKSSDDIADELVALSEKDKNFKQIMSRVLRKMNGITNSYDIEHTFNLYCNARSSFEDANLSDTEKEDVFCFCIAYHLVKNFAYKYTIEAMQTWYGSTEIMYEYSKDGNGNYILDANGNKIVSSSTNVNTRYETLATVLEEFRLAAEKIKQNYILSCGSDEFTVSFDMCGFGIEQQPSSVKAEGFNTIRLHKPIDPVLDAEDPFFDKVFFVGWSIDPNGETLWDWNSDIIVEDTVLYAIWEKVNNYVSYAVLRKNNNPSIYTDRYGTVDESRHKILFCLERDEFDENDKYYVEIHTPLGCTCDITPYDKVRISTVNGDEVSTFDAHDNQNTYSLVLYELESPRRALSYIHDGGTLNQEMLQYDVSLEGQLTTLPKVSKEGMVFKGWSTVEDDPEMIVTKVTADKANHMVLYAIYEEAEYLVSYFDRDGREFTGTHGEGYPTKIKFNKTYELDKPTKKGNVFISYYNDKECITEPVRAIYKYTSTEDRKLYAFFMDECEYAAFHGGIVIDDTLIDLANTIFYTSLITAKGEIWSISGTGLNIFTANGDKIRSLTGLIGGKAYIPVGIVFIKGANRTITLAIVRHRSENKVYLYYSLDYGVTWIEKMECTEFSFLLSDSCSSETVAYLTFYKAVVYNNHMYAIDLKSGGTETYISIDDDTEYLTWDKLDELNLDICIGKRMLGLSVTMSGEMYVLIENVGIIKGEFFEPTFDSSFNFSGYNPKMKWKGIAGWRDNFYNIDNVNIGSPMNGVKQNINLNDDFDIDDQEMLDRVNSYYADKYKYFKTFLSLRNEEEISDEDWIWKYGTANSGVLLSEKAYIVENFDSYRPTIHRDRNTIRLAVRNPDRFKEIPSVSDVEVPRTVKMTKDNGAYYIGWTRVIGSGNSESYAKITEQYLIDHGILNGTREENWVVKFTRSELVKKTITNVYGQVVEVEVYDTPEREMSSVYQRYLKYGKI